MTTRSGQGVERPTVLRLAAAGLLAPGLLAANLVHADHSMMTQFEVVTA